MAVRHVLSLAEVGTEAVAQLVRRSVQFGAGQVKDRSLSGRVVGIYFRGTSTRTRTSFSAAALKLGGQIISYGPKDLQLVTGETLADTGRVLSGYLDALVIRTNESMEEMKILADQERMAVVNAMNEAEHPTQALADLSTLLEHFGRLDGLHVLYVGEGNNSAAALALATALTPGMRLTLVTPEGFGVPEDYLERAQKLAKTNGASVEHHHRVNDLPRGVDAVYATRWQTMGVAKKVDNWKPLFRPLCVTPELMERVSKPGGNGTVFMHDLPAVRGEDVTDEVLDGPRSLAWRQAEHKMFSAMAVLEWCLEEAALR